jgi:pimeloyl-ACP methyl ester carboxylesterase
MKSAAAQPRVCLLASALALCACPSRSSTSAPAHTTAARVAAPGAATPGATAAGAQDAGTGARTGSLMMYSNGSRIGLERFRDDGTTLTSRIIVVSTGVEVQITRAPRHVVVRQGQHGEQRSEQDVPADTVVLENGGWQQFAIMAEWFPHATTPTPVHVLLPAQGSTADGTLTVRPGAAGGRTVELTLGPQTMTVDVGADGLVTHAAVPAQSVDVRPESAAAPTVVYPPPPAGITEELLEVTRGAVVLRGTLWRPATAAGPVPVMVLIAGSGPTDREGNNILGDNANTYRMLAEALARRGVATVRFDKRNVGASGHDPNLAAFTLEDGVADAQAFVERVRGDARFSSVTIAGHSEGGLYALRLAERVPVNAVVLIASVGRPFGAILREQYARHASPATMTELDRVFAEIRAGHAPTSTDPRIQAELHPDINAAYMRSEIDLDPAAILHGLHMPATVIQGEADSQVMVADARALAAARPDAHLVLLARMNHVLKEVSSPEDNRASYLDATRPLAPGVIEAVIAGVPSQGGATTQGAATTTAPRDP